MKERPILFSSPTVRAILSGSKTQTRRVVKPKHEPDAVWGRDEDTGIGRTFRFGEHAPTGAVPWWNLGGINGASQHCPYGQPGDRLWVRETWQGPLFDYDQWDAYREDHRRFETPAFCQYAADGGAPPEFVDDEDEMQCKWRPSIRMPRWASRITLEITDVRVERLCDISEADAKAEGCPCYVCGAPLDGHSESDCHCFHRTATASDYRDLWEQINGAGSWDANPWVWVVSFRRIEQEAAR